MNPVFGAGSHNLLERLRRPRVGVADLHAAAAHLRAVLATPELQIDVLGERSGEPVFMVAEAERCVQIHLADLAEDMTRAHVPATPEGIIAALVSWVAHRPVPDAVAADAGIAVLDWIDGANSALGWRVVVPRDQLVLPWLPSPTVDPAAVYRARSAATGRSFAVPVQLRVEGPVALWSYPAQPLLAAAVLVAPERMLAAVGAAGLQLRDMHVVITPQRPVACADPAVAQRLAGETVESCLTLPWRALADLPWI